MQITLSQNVADFIIYALLELIVYSPIVRIIKGIMGVDDFSWLGSRDNMSVHISRKCMHQLFNVDVGNCGAHQGPIE